MKEVSSTAFRMQASKLFDAVERGEQIVVLRHGKPIAEIRPIAAAETRDPSWLLDDLRDAAIVNLAPVVIAGTVQVLQAAPLRAADAMHVAAALAWNAELFVSADHRQLAAARAAALEVKPV